MTQECFSSILICAGRVSRLDSTGAPDAGANNLYVFEAPIQVGLTFIVSEGASLELKNGCDIVCASYEGEDRLKGINLSMELCVLDHELIEMLTGASLIVSGAATIGHLGPAIDAAAQDGVSFEFWTQRWDGNEQDDVLPYWQWGIPKTKWRMGDPTFTNEILRIPLIGKGYANAQFGNGPANDWPYGGIPGLYGVQADATIPEASCGRQELAAS